MRILRRGIVTSDESAYLSKHRLEAMTDGFYAIVITIGVLTINDEGIPPIPPGDMWCMNCPIFQVLFVRLPR